MHEAGTPIVTSRGESLMQPRGGYDQISGQLKGQAKADTLHDEKVEQYVEKLCWVALIAMLSVHVLMRTDVY